MTPQREERSTMQITTIGLDLAKHWFQIHGVDANGQVVVRRRLWRGVIPFFRSLEPCLVGIDDIFAVQDEITLSTVGAIEPSLRAAEIERVKRKRPECSASL